MSIKITRQALEYFMYISGVDNRDEAEEFLQTVIGMCVSVPTTSAGDLASPPENQGVLDNPPSA